jgi:hypothetical protein
MNTNFQEHQYGRTARGREMYDDVVFIKLPKLME